MSVVLRVRTPGEGRTDNRRESRGRLLGPAGAFWGLDLPLSCPLSAVTPGWALLCARRSAPWPPNSHGSPGRLASGLHWRAGRSGLWELEGLAVTPRSSG